MQRCLLLAGLDYNYFTIDNNMGELCAHYPSHLMIFKNDKHHPFRCIHVPLSVSDSGKEFQNMYDPVALKKMITDAKNARCRSRFPLPVILFNGKYVCRSATLSGGPEVYGRAGLDYIFSGGEKDLYSVHERMKQLDVTPQPWKDDCMEQSMFTDWQLLDKVRSYDITLLKALMVDTIVDFMVEKKKVKYGLK